MLSKYYIESFDTANADPKLAHLFDAPRMEKLPGQETFDVRLLASIVRKMKTWELSSRSGMVFHHSSAREASLDAHFVQEGSAKFGLNGSEREIPAGYAWLRSHDAKIRIEMSPGTRIVSVSIPRARYSAFVSTAGGEPDERLSSLEAKASVKDCGLTVVEQMVLAMIGQSPETHPLEKAQPAALLLKEAIITALIEYWPVASTGLPTMGHRRKTRRAILWLQEHIAEEFTIEDLAKQAGASIRALQLAFREELGMSPASYVQRLRLQKIHTDLLDPTNNESVAEVARKWGFGHLGYFAARYRVLYGEAPSETRKKRL
ncbi:helix-turn-helix domain-containing protein [Rhizobium sp. L1K21]|uniref:helix-turn-helix domain-containing protein n=1 Tax=Rhizobium sp. L1K21 TaxID=2954933 RepID=UPI0020926553|nr:helix-turn-helix domain-containing protein [Rhizobium sp. L1K21]MCO6188613.1 helix-turn-helix transcriptional regulator [Rhizobium sp. L1K21]